MTDFNEILERHHRMMADLEAQKQAMAKQVRDGLENGFKQFFQVVPEAKSVVWVQYTPYFNDGDECIFSVREYEVHESEEPDYEYGEGGLMLNPPGQYCYENAKKEPNGWGARQIKEYEDTLENLGGTERVNQIKEAMKMLDSIFSLGDDFFKDTFGNHVRVIATAGGFEINEHDHD